MTREPDPLPRSLLGVFDKVRRQLNPAGEATLVAGFRRRRDSTLISLKVSVAADSCAFVGSTSKPHLHH